MQIVVIKKGKHYKLRIISGIKVKAVFCKKCQTSLLSVSPSAEPLLTNEMQNIPTTTLKAKHGQISQNGMFDWSPDPNISLSPSHCKKATNVRVLCCWIIRLQKQTDRNICIWGKLCKTHHHLLKEVNDLLLREVHGAVVKEGLRDGQLGLRWERVSWVLDEGLFLLHARFPETCNAVALEENKSAWWVSEHCRRTDQWSESKFPWSTRHTLKVVSIKMSKNTQVFSYLYLVVFFWFWHL